jgi:hypothetical protein
MDMGEDTFSLMRKRQRKKNRKKLVSITKRYYLPLAMKLLEGVACKKCGVKTDVPILHALICGKE